jgi:CSLREA domain-containing protein
MKPFRGSRLALITVTVAMRAVVATIAASPAYASAYFVTSLADTVSADGVCTLREAMFTVEDVPRNGDCGLSFEEFDTIFIWVVDRISAQVAWPERRDSSVS